MLSPNNSPLSSDVIYITDKFLSTVTSSAEGIGKIIQNLDWNKGHGHDNMSIRMLKTYGVYICISLKIIFQQYFVFIIKRSDKWNFKNHCLVFLTSSL